MTTLAYVDASALVKLILIEPESRAFYRWFIEAERITTSRVGIVETLRAAARYPHDPAQRDRVVQDVEVLEMDPTIGRVASAIEPAVVRTLDAIHVATALQLISQLDAFVTYDDRLAEAARKAGLPVVSPA